MLDQAIICFDHQDSYHEMEMEDEKKDMLQCIAAWNMKIMCELMK
jgi:hypothetical protein